MVHRPKIDHEIRGVMLRELVDKEITFVAHFIVKEHVDTADGGNDERFVARLNMEVLRYVSHLATLPNCSRTELEKLRAAVGIYVTGFWRE
ncbi:MAG: hypothetical protein CMJ64_25985 [Planctomycetaceae bacterium]|nr:hypothetical protein [Planctomycetaceae bacterium]